MKATTDKLWLFDYSDGVAYEAFSKCETQKRRSQVISWTIIIFKVRKFSKLELEVENSHHFWRLAKFYTLLSVVNP